MNAYFRNTSKLNTGSRSLIEQLEHGQHMLLVVLVHTVSYVQSGGGLRSNWTDHHKTP